MSKQIREFGTLNYSRCLGLLGGRDRMRIGPNTYLERDGDDCAVRLYDTKIIVFYSNGMIRLDSGGYQTVTTKQRMLNLSPVPVYAVGGTWYAGDGLPFFDGMLVWAS